MFLDVPNNVSILTYYVVSKFFNDGHYNYASKTELQLSYSARFWIARRAKYSGFSCQERYRFLFAYA